MQLLASLFRFCIYQLVIVLAVFSCCALYVLLWLLAIRWMVCGFVQCFFGFLFRFLGRSNLDSSAAVATGRGVPDVCLFRPQCKSNGAKQGKPRALNHKR